MNFASDWVNSKIFLLVEDLRELVGGFEVFFEKSNDEIYSDLESSVEYMNAKIQKIVDKAPEQYQWTYKRFSIQPDGEPPFYWFMCCWME